MQWASHSSGRLPLAETDDETERVRVSVLNDKDGGWEFSAFITG
jgi:hypothetical protein